MTLVSNRFAKFDSQEDADVPVATNQIYEGIASRPKKTGDASINRASAAPHCYRRRFLNKNDPKPGEPISPRREANLMMGHLVEAQMLALIKAFDLGPGKIYSEVEFGKPLRHIVIDGLEIVEYEQPQDETIVGEYTFTCHADGYGKRNSDGLWELIEVKSSNDKGYEYFKKNGAGDYLKQSHVNMRSKISIEKNVQDVRYFFMKKNTSHIWDRLHHFDQEIFDLVVKEAALANGLSLPARPYKPEAETFRSKPTGRQKLPWQCGYCNRTQQCWPEAKLEFKSGKPIWVVK